MPVVIADTSPLQYLHQVRYLSLLPDLFGEVIVPTAVVDELERGLAAGQDVPVVRALDWARVQAATVSPRLANARGLHPGEAAALTIALAAEEQQGTGAALVLLDDLDARIWAYRLGITYTGTLGVPARGKQAGLVPAVAPLVGELIARGFRISAALREAVLNAVGEGSSSAR